MQHAAIRHVNAMPAPTWHRLEMNHADISIDAMPAFASPASIEATGFLESPSPDAFESALAGLSRRSASSAPLFAEDAQEGLDASALSGYQKTLVERERTEDFAASFATGAGRDAASFLETLAQRRRVLATAPGAKDAQASVFISAGEAKACACALDIVLACDSEAQVEIVFEGADARDAFLGSTVRAFCGARSRLRLSFIQAAGSTATVLDDAGCVLDDHASLETRHFALSTGKSYTGLSCDLRGEGATTQAGLRYLGRDDAQLDFNYVFNHHGARTESDLNANGVLAGESTKTLKATIDFVRGCKGASGHEQETALISDERAHNRSCPVILCGEDDVAGEHGASIGHIDAEQMFYLASRGLSTQQSEALFCRSVVKAAHAAAADERARRAVSRIALDMFESDDQDEAKETPCIAQ